jgi:putative restriction endonuclease
MDGGWPSGTDLDSRVRVAAFAFLAEQVEARGEVLPHGLLVRGFEFHGQRVPLMGPQGIFKPALLDLRISITTVPVVEGRPRPYEERSIRKAFSSIVTGAPTHHTGTINVCALRWRAGHQIYFDGVVPGQYLASWPVFIVGDDPANLSFRVDVDTRRALGEISQPEAVAEAHRQYVISTVRHRVHQIQFRYRVLKAYREHCAVCRLRHLELLDAAHILPDGHPKGEPVVPNGLALCKLHHAAFDRHILGVCPDLVVEIRQDILTEEDGPMLRHGLQEFQGARITVPGSPGLKPHPDYLAERYELFRKAS